MSRRQARSDVIAEYDDDDLAMAVTASAAPAPKRRGRKPKSDNDTTTKPTRPRARKLTLDQIDEYGDEDLPPAVVPARAPVNVPAPAHAYDADTADIEDYDDDDLVAVSIADAVDRARAALKPPSDEQIRIIDAIARGNVVVDAVAGSGKTTTVLHMALRYNTQKILLLTYNAKLKFETRDRADALGLAGLEVHTYHSFCCKYVDRLAYRDATIAENIYDAAGDLRRDIYVHAYDIIIIDEVQDMTPLYYDVSRVAIGKYTPRLCVLGDRGQSIYGFMGADPRYITLAERMWHGHAWERWSLTTSYRITRQMAAFVNALTRIGNVDAPIMRAVKDGPMPVYMYSDVFKLAARIEATAALDPGDVFVLAKSVRQHTDGGRRGDQRGVIAQLVDHLSRMNVLLYVPTSDSAVPDSKVTRGKLVFSTFHQAKGLERKHVFVIGFDESQVNSEASTLRCSNEMYVACTRASETLTVWHNVGNKFGRQVTMRGPLPFLPGSLLDGVCEYWPTRPNIARMRAAAEIKLHRHLHFDGVTDMLRHLQDVYVKLAVSRARITEVEHDSDGLFITIPSIVRQTIDIAGERKTIYEEVSGITGTAVAAAHELAQRGDCTIYRAIVHDGSEIPSSLRADVAEPLLRVAYEYTVQKAHMSHLRRQITELNWVRDDQMKRCTDRMIAVIPCRQAVYEDMVQCPGFDPRVVWSTNASRKGEARADCVIGQTDILTADGKLFEIKTVSEILDEHIVQLLMYGYAYLCRGKAYEMYLFNVLDDTLLRVEISVDDLLYAMRAINHAKNHTSDAVDDAAFVARSGYMSPEVAIATCPQCVGKFAALPVNAADALAGREKVEPKRGKD